MHSDSGETFEINMKPGKYKMFEIFDEGFKITKKNNIKELRKMKCTKNLKKIS